MRCRLERQDLSALGIAQEARQSGGGSQFGVEVILLEFQDIQHHRAGQQLGVAQFDRLLEKLLERRHALVRHERPDFAFDGRITGVTPEALALAKKRGYAIKLIGDVPALTVRPTLVPLDSPIAVAGTLNSAAIYTDLSGKPEVYQLIQECVEQVNADLAHDAMVADTQVHRFLVLHKELDPDDDELTRTRKVRRNFVAEKYAVLIDALYGGKASQFIETEVKFEDGRKGKVAADLVIRDVKVFPKVTGRAA